MCAPNTRVIDVSTTNKGTQNERSREENDENCTNHLFL